MRILNRVVTWTIEASTEADQRHAEIIVRELELQNSAPLTVPGAKNTADPEDDEQSTRVVKLRRLSKARLAVVLVNDEQLLRHEWRRRVGACLLRCLDIAPLLLAHPAPHLLRAQHTSHLQNAIRIGLQPSSIRAHTNKGVLGCDFGH